MFAAIKRTDQQQVAAEKARLVEMVPLLALLAPVGGWVGVVGRAGGWLAGWQLAAGQDRSAHSGCHSALGASGFRSSALLR